MRLGLRLLFAFFLINGIAAFFVLRVFTAEIKPSAREVMEDLMVDTAYALAELAADAMRRGEVPHTGAQDSAFAHSLRRYSQRPVDASIWGLHKQTLDLRIYLIGSDGRVLVDSAGVAQGQDFSRWRDVVLTLRGAYGARATREIPTDDTSSVMHVSAPVWVDGRIAAVLTVAKPNRTVQAFLDRSERKLLLQGVVFLALSAAVGVAVTLWMVWNVRRLRRYAQSVQSTDPAARAPAVPHVPGELGDLAQAMEQMRLRLQGRDYVEGYVRALTHELKSPVAALRGAGELLQDDLPEADRIAFAQQVVQQSERLQRLIDRLLELSKLEQRPPVHPTTTVSLQACAHAALERAQARAQLHRVTLVCNGHGASGAWEAELVTLAIGNLLDNAIEFSAPGQTVRLELDGPCVHVQDQGPGVPEYALARLGERFYTTARPSGERSGSGLGLAIVRRIMTLHDGELHLVNTAPGLRATLDFTPTSQTSHAAHTTA